MEDELSLSVLSACHAGRYRYRVEATIEGVARTVGTRDNPVDALALAAHAFTLGAHQVIVRHFARHARARREEP